MNLVIGVSPTRPGCPDGTNRPALKPAILPIRRPPGEDSGPRREELAHLEDKRVHVMEGYIEVFSNETEDWRVIPLSLEVVSILDNYVAQRTLFTGTVQAAGATRRSYS